MKKRIKKLNNQGSTLLTVIICLAFIGVLGSMMLSATMTNLQMKIVESKSKKNFYSCEMSMEEVRVGIQELTAKAIKTVYEEEVLSNFAAYLGSTETQINMNIQDLVVAQLRLELTTLADAVVDDGDMFNGFLLSTEGIGIMVGSITSMAATETEAASLVVHDIKIDYEKDDYKTSITSDIKITIPNFTFNQGTLVHSSMEQPFQDYVLVADGTISSINSTGTNNIKGSVYAGGNILIDNDSRSGNHQVNIDGNNIVTRGNITVSDTAKLTIGTTDSPSIWADNLVTQTSPTYDQSESTLTTDITIEKGTCVIKDDLVLEGRNSKVEFSLGGAYIGYTGTHTSEGSAIMINGSGSSLNLSDLSTLILAGRAHVSIGETETNTDYILTGESVAFKSNQRAYLVPGKFINNILHNPVTATDIMPPGASTPIVPIINIVNDPPINYFDFVKDSIKPYKIAAKQTASSTLRYYYLNFGSGILADEFLQRYKVENPSFLNRMEPFSLGNVTLPVSGVVSCVGNIMSYPDKLDGTDKSVDLKKGLSTTLREPDPILSPYKEDTDIDNYVANLTLDPAIVGSELGGVSISQLSGLYSRMTHLLTLEDTSVYEELDQVVDSSIIQDIVIKIANGILVPVNVGYTFSTNSSFTDFDLNHKYLVVIDGDATIANGAVLNGILIASGKITVGDSATINGMVISTGETGDGDINLGNGVTVNGRLVAANNIKLGTNCSLETNELVETELIAPVFTEEGTILSNLFNNAKTTINFTTTIPGDLLVDLSMSNLISYENWRKN